MQVSAPGTPAAVDCRRGGVALAARGSTGRAAPITEPLIPAERPVYLVDPLEDTAGQIHGRREAVLPQQGDGPGAPRAALAVHDDFGDGVELTKPSGKLGEGDEAAARQPADRGLDRIP